MTTSFLTLRDGDVIKLDKATDYHRPAHVIDRRSVVAINAALATGRPLLVRGEPGVGKSQLARAAAVQLGRRFRHHAVDASTEPRDLLYTVDAVARLAEAQLVGALGKGTRNDVAIDKFIRPGALWWAFDWGGAAAQEQRAVGTGTAGGRTRDLALTTDPDGTPANRGAVLLIDEIDKADSAIPNALLDALGHRRFDVPGFGMVEMKGEWPLVIITTNEERALPDAFLRRCFVLHLGLPDDAGEAAVREALRVRGKAHFPGCESGILKQAAELIARRRSQQRNLGSERVPPPGVAEYIDLIDAVLGQRSEGGDAIALLNEIAMFVLDKHAQPASVASERDA
ncbi:MAG TPA: MoxR family ATPase [Kofleriaceae bacterium]|jgi:MoxR-like ATPase|nr:MoxR family ATPase [Kofleriaceae bacterium]